MLTKRKRTYVDDTKKNNTHTYAYEKETLVRIRSKHNKCTGKESSIQTKKENTSADEKKGACVRNQSIPRIRNIYNMYTKTNVTYKRKENTQKDNKPTHKRDKTKYERNKKDEYIYERTIGYI